MYDLDNRGGKLVNHYCNQKHSDPLPGYDYGKLKQHQVLAYTTSDSSLYTMRRLLILPTLHHKFTQLIYLGTMVTTKITIKTRPVYIGMHVQT